MKKISIIFPADFASERDIAQYKPTVDLISGQGRMCKYYGISKSSPDKGKVYANSYYPYFVSRIYSILLKILKLPAHKAFLMRLELFDRFAAVRASADDSSVVLVDMMLPRTASACKNMGKTVVVYTGSSFPGRECARIHEEYEKYGIKSNTLFGDKRYKEKCCASLNICDYYIAITEVSAKTYFNAGYSKDKCVVIPKNGTDFEIYRDAATTQTGERAFVSTAFHSFSKGTHRLLDAWNNLKSDSAKLYIIGDLHDDMREFIKKYGPFKNVVFTGPLSRDQMREMYKKLDAVGILMSLSEGAGKVTPEMMSFGFPQIVSPDATCDLIIDGFNGFIVETEDTAGLVNKLKWFAEDWNRVHEMRNNVYQSVTRRKMIDFSIELGEYLMSL